MAPHNFEDLLQCAIPVFDGLLPNNNHNKIIQDLLFTLAHWHGLAKLRMHSDLTLDILDTATTEVTCSDDSRSLRHAKEATRRSQVDKGKKTAGQAEKLTADKPLHRTVSFNLQTYKFHALGDYVSCIRRFGTTDSYSMEPSIALEREDTSGQTENLLSGSSHKSNVAKLESGASSVVFNRQNQCEKNHDDIGSYLHAREGDPAMKIIFFVVFKCLNLVKKPKEISVTFSSNEIEFTTTTLLESTTQPTTLDGTKMSSTPKPGTAISWSSATTANLEHTIATPGC
ncbi:uncharacterized protein F5147DRAFT_783966 [Suillus discolor]|uniref:Uncharacterized protein n=1 Tax=Suillus discolor TaxID=1912936 RepID=A0A9P7JL01_9AGAM|nr:uncharacterized protein F5147DRAFT_783966 [Suillus discolor]KAG2081012.1 hypothetical protein F5147DRAFT_783966 [Suillus discolor]